MAHEIRHNDRFGEVRKNGQRAWHGLGLEIEDGLTAEDGFEQIGLGWRTVLAPVHATVEVMGENGPEVRTVQLEGKGEKGSTPMAHLRADDMTLLGMVTEQYKPFENMDLARFADSLAGADAAVTIETGGSLHNGRRVFALVKLPQVVKAAADDIMEQYVLVQNGHGGFATLSCYPTSVRVVCANTLRWSERDLAKGIRFRHSGNFEDKVKQAKTVLGTAIRETERFQEQVTALAGRQLGVVKSRELFFEIYDNTFGRLPGKEQVTEEVLDKLTAKRLDMVRQWEANLENERNSLASIRGTAWAALNAVTEFHDHQRGRFKGIEESDARVASNIFGVSSRHKAIALKAALATV